MASHDMIDRLSGHMSCEQVKVYFSDISLIQVFIIQIPTVISLVIKSFKKFQELYALKIMSCDLILSSWARISWDLIQHLLAGAHSRSTRASQIEVSSLSPLLLPSYV